MADITTIPTQAASEQLPLLVVLEDDPTPLVRLIGGRFREAVRAGHAGQADDVLGETAGTVAVRSHDTPQAATIRYDGGTVEVSSGVLVEADATVVVDLQARFATVEEPTGDAVLAAATLRALRPPLPHWREAAERLWGMTRAIPGIPDVLVVDALCPSGPERARFGDGPTEYLVAGAPDVLAGVFSGADDLLAALDAGLRVKGTLSQLSVMTAASWKVRFDV